MNLTANDFCVTSLYGLQTNPKFKMCMLYLHESTVLMSFLTKTT